MNYRIGFGYDVHRLKKGESLIIGGVKINHSKGSVGHSDGDILLHAICDGLLGAANLRDIGYHFPDTDSAFKDIDSKILLRKTVDLLAGRGYKIGNIDSTICLQVPKLSNYIPEMKKVISNVLGVIEDKVSIKATTTERLGFVGIENGLSAYATVLIYS